MRNVSGVLVLAVFSTIALAGCQQGPPMGEVSGTVTIDGEAPPEGSSITFMPEGGGKPTAGALINEDGSYKVSVPIGMTKVEIRASREMKRRGPKREGPGAEAPGGGLIVEILPPKYNNETELTYDVKEGEQEKDWEIVLNGS